MDLKSQESNFFVKRQKNTFELISKNDGKTLGQADYYYLKNAFYSKENQDTTKSNLTPLGALADKTSTPVWVITKVTITPIFQGQGLAAFLMRQVLLSAENDGVKIMAKCPYAANFILKNSEFKHLTI